MPEDKIITNIQSGGAGFSHFAKTLTSGFVPVEGCKLCNSKYIKEAHEMAEQHKSHNAIHRFLVEKGENLSYGAVHNHLKIHFEELQTANNIQALSKKLDKWSCLTKTDDILLSRYVDLLDMEAMELLGLNIDGLPAFERRKNDELILKIVTIVLACKEQLRKTHAEKRPVEVVITSLNRIIQFKLDGSTNPEVRKCLLDVVEQLTREIGDISISGQAELENN